MRRVGRASLRRRDGGRASAAGRDRSALVATVALEAGTVHGAGTTQTCASPPSTAQHGDRLVQGRAAHEMVPLGLTGPSYSTHSAWFCT